MKAIETRWNGFLFRSRTEARWAVFFDAMGWRWEYEPEGFRFSDRSQYLPDFWLQEFNAWVEIKPFGNPAVDEHRKASMLAAESRKTVLVICGQPGVIDDKYRIVVYGGHRHPDCSFTAPRIFASCRHCSGPVIAFNTPKNPLLSHSGQLEHSGRFFMQWDIQPCECEPGTMSKPNARMNNALRKASSERFGT